MLALLMIAQFLWALGRPFPSSHSRVRRIRLLLLEAIFQGDFALVRKLDASHPVLDGLQTEPELLPRLDEAAPHLAHFHQRIDDLDATHALFRLPHPTQAHIGQNESARSTNASRAMHNIGRLSAGMML
jgi:hypothetical protein